MPRRKRVPPKPVPEDTVVIEHDDEFDGCDSDSETSTGSRKSNEEETTAVCDVSNESEDVIAILKRSRSTNPNERKAALRSMCPCRVKRAIDPFWVRIVEMCSDPDDSVRYQVLHDLCDGSPSHLEDLVAETVHGFWNDSNEKIRRSARRAYGSWQRGDGINIL